jgi:hypothetical protein
VATIYTERHLGDAVSFNYLIWLDSRDSPQADGAKPPLIDWNLDADRGYGHHCWDWNRRKDISFPDPEGNPYNAPCTWPTQAEDGTFNKDVALQIHWAEFADPGCDRAPRAEKTAGRARPRRGDGTEGSVTASGVETGMRVTKQRSRCQCECHRAPARDEPCPRCGCGRSGDGCAEPERGACPPPETCPFPGTVELPQEQAPPTFRNEPKRPELEDKPPRGDAGELPWFRNRIRRTLREGPTFGPRKDEFLPFLFVRASSGDIGNRPLAGVFWESPDIYVLPDVRAEAAPLQPPALGGVAKAQRPNTLYAHV